MPRSSPTVRDSLENFLTKTSINQEKHALETIQQHNMSVRAAACRDQVLMMFRTRSRLDRSRSAMCTTAYVRPAQKAATTAQCCIAG